MFRKGSALFAILSFVVFSSACVYWPTREIRNEGDYPAPGREVARVVTANGEVIDFTGPGRGRLLIDSVQGRALVSTEQTVEIKKPLGLVKKRADGSISEVTDAAGRAYYVLEVVNDGPDSLVIKERRTETRVVSIPLAEVRLIKYRKTNGILTAMAVAAAGVVGLTIVLMLALSGDDM